MERRIVVNAGNHDRNFCPVNVLLPTKIAQATLYDEKGEEVPCQLEPSGEQTQLSFIVKRLGAGGTAEYALKEGKKPRSAEKAELGQKENMVDVRISGRHFTTYHYGGKDFVRPYLFPVVAPCGAKVTRSYPMIQGVPGETSDHRHHRSIWIAHGDVNKVDNWSEEKGHGATVHREFLSRISGPVYAKIGVRNDWVDSVGKKVLTEESTFTFYNVTEKGHIFDVVVNFKATEGRVVFGDTKEGGIISVRMASSIDVPRGGTIVNSYGGINERETWGKKAHWCDYYGPTEGKVAGIAIMDHSTNLRHPTNWHVRNYGLMTANCFGLSHFTGDKSVNGDYTLEAGRELVFRYRLYVHDGTTAEADVAGKYHDFINPPVVEVG